MGVGGQLQGPGLWNHLRAALVMRMVSFSLCVSPSVLNKGCWGSVAQRDRLYDPMDAAHQASLPSISWSLFKLMSIESVMSFNHLILCCPLLLPPATFPSIRVFSNVSALRIRWPKYRSFSFSISPSSEYSGLIPLGWTGLDKRGHLNLGLVWWLALTSAGLGGCMRVPLS